MTARARISKITISLPSEAAKFLIKECDLHVQALSKTIACQPSKENLGAKLMYDQLEKYKVIKAAAEKGLEGI